MIKYISGLQKAEHRELFDREPEEKYISISEELLGLLHWGGIERGGTRRSKTIIKLDPLNRTSAFPPSYTHTFSLS